MNAIKAASAAIFTVGGMLAAVASTATSAMATPAYTATGVQFVQYTGNGYTCSDWLNRSASGIVTEWRGSGDGLSGTTADSGCTPEASPNSTLLFKPYTSSKVSCDQTNLVLSFIATYGSSATGPATTYFGPYTDTTGYGAGNPNAFWTAQNYLVCFYPLAYQAQGNFTWWAYDQSLTRTTTFDVRSAGYGITPGGTFSYSDTAPESYTVSPTCVSVPTPSYPGVTNTVFFGGPLANLSASLSGYTGQYLYSKATDNDPTNGDMYWGSFVASNPCPIGGSPSDPPDGPFTQSGSAIGQITSGDISITPIVG